MNTLLKWAIGGAPLAAAGIALLVLLTGRVANAQSPQSVGQWSGPIDFSIVAIHMHLLPTGKVMFWEEGKKIRLWDPVTGTISTPALLPGHSIPSSGHSFLADGRLLVTGGFRAPGNEEQPNDTSIYDALTDTWERGPNMNRGRFYPTNTTLANGDVLVLSGLKRGADINRLPQVFQADSGTWRNLTNAQAEEPLGEGIYPLNFLAPDGRVFKAGPDQDTWFLDTSDLGAWTRGPDSHLSQARDRFESPAVVYDGKVLLIGGGVDPPTNSVELIDLNEDNPLWEEMAPMEFARINHNATFLPDGKVLVTGGTSLRFNDAERAVLEAESWDPKAGTWSTMASMSVDRLYHSTALLLPDGRVLSAGGGKPTAEGSVDHEDAEIYSPPYLFRGLRPTITSAPSAVTYGKTFFILTPDAANITKVTLVRLGSVTHSFDQNQRFVTLPSSQATGGLNVTVPSNANLAPRGHYMLFILDGDGVPSVATIVRLEGAGDNLLVTMADTPDPVRLGQNLTYTVTITNNGPSDATGVTLNDTLPAGVSFVSATPTQGSCGGTSTVACNLGDLSNGASAMVTIIVTPTLAGGLSNTVTVAADDPNPPNNTVTAETTVNPKQFALTVSLAGLGSGTVTSSPAGINCSTDCSELYDSRTVIALNATAGTGSTFLGWSGGGCSGNGTCMLTINADTTVTATFDSPGTPFTFTDDPLSSKATFVKAIHFLEALDFINTLRQRNGLGTISFAAPIPAAGVPISAKDMITLQTGLNELFDALGRTRPTFDSIVAGVTAIGKLQIEQIRNAIRAAESLSAN